MCACVSVRPPCQKEVDPWFENHNVKVVHAKVYSQIRHVHNGMPGLASHPFKIKLHNKAKSLMHVIEKTQALAWEMRQSSMPRSAAACGFRIEYRLQFEVPDLSLVTADSPDSSPAAQGAVQQIPDYAGWFLRFAAHFREYVRPICSIVYCIPLCVVSVSPSFS